MKKIIKLEKIKSVIKEEIKYQLIKKSLINNIDNKTLSRILKEDEMAAVLGGTPNPIISAPDLSENGGTITISKAKGVAGIIIKTRHSSTINNIMPPPIFSNSIQKDTIKLQYSVSLSTTQGTPSKIPNVEHAFIKYEAKYENNMIVFTIDFKDDYRSIIKNKPIAEKLDIFLPTDKAYMPNKFKIDVQQM